MVRLSRGLRLWLGLRLCRFLLAGMRVLILVHLLIFQYTAAEQRLAMGVGLGFRSGNQIGNRIGGRVEL